MRPTDTGDETNWVLQVVIRESAAFWDKDYEAWSQCWLHSPGIRMMGWWARGGIMVIEGWEALSSRIMQTMAASPEPNPTASEVRRENVNVRIAGDMAWLTFDQLGRDTGDTTMDMAGTSYETRVLEKHGSEWKIVYAGWLLADTGNL